MASIKIERLNRIYQEEISNILMREVKDKNIKFVTITGVNVTNDLSFAKIYYTVLDKDNIDAVAESLKKASSFIRTMLAERVNIRHTPELVFVYDKSIDYGEHIENVIKEINSKKVDN